MAATCVVQPIDLIKTRMQLATATPGVMNHGFVNTFQSVAATEGFGGLYRGLTAALFRQMTYTTGRLGTFGVLKDFMSPDGSPLPFYKKAFAGMVAGGIGAVVGTPAEVALIRMTADGRLPAAERRGYTNVVNALSRVTKEEGLLTLWRGTMPTVGRAMVLNIAQLATYDQAKENILRTGVVGDNIYAHAMASTCSAFFATIVSIPLDSAKTRVQNMRVVNGVPEYTGMLDALTKTARREGFFSLWKGMTPYFLRLGPHTILTFICLEQFKAAYYRSLKR
ncbi:2-oxoglutarate/malate carrier protein [Gracilaria domingensis]|nr:2-oxoglutarate/malate carrier protein [Gracilaria domingensis]